MAQPQHPLPARAFSPPQASPSQTSPQAAFAYATNNKRPRLSPGPSSQPGSPYTTSPYAGSPGAVGTPSTAATSPGYSGAIQLPSYPSPYTNGHTPAIGLSLPDTRSIPAPTLATPQMPAMTNSPYSNAVLAPVPAAVAQSGAAAPGAMGPPTRPPDRPAKELEYDVMDSLAGTGIDIHAEEQYMQELFAASEDQVPDARTGFSYNHQAGKLGLHGAGLANQIPGSTEAQEQERLVAMAAEKAWNEASYRLASTRTQELNDPFLLVALLHRKAEKIAKEHGIGLNLDTTTQPASMGRMKVPNNFSAPTITVGVKTLPDYSVVSTTGSWIPHDSFLVDQLALMSIATKRRVRQLVADADMIASTRQATSHGEVYEDWIEAAAPLVTGAAAQDQDGALRTGAESAVSPRTNPLKRRYLFGAGPNM